MAKLKPLPSIVKLFQEKHRVLQEIEAVQNKCKHPEEYCQYKLCSDVGNWDREDDTYWTKYYCTKCCKYWTVDGSCPRGSRVSEITRWGLDNDR